MKRALKVIGIVIAVVIVLILVLPFVINVNSFRPRIESELTDALGRKVTVGNLSLSLWSGSLAADDIAIADDPAFSSSPFIRAKALNVGVELIPLILSKTVHVTDLTLSEPQVTLLRRSTRWNFSTLGNAGSAKTGTAPPSTAGRAQSAPVSKESRTPATPSEGASPSSGSSIEGNLSVQKLSIKSGQISVAESSKPGKAHVYSNVDLTVKDFALSSQFPFTLTADLPGRGNLKLEGTAGPINAQDAAATPFQAKLSIKGLDLAASGFIDPSSGFAGDANFDATVNSDGREVRSSGNSTADKLKLSPKGSPAQRAVELRYATNYDLERESGQLTQGDVTVGKAVSKLSGTFDLRGETAALNMKLNADNMPVDDLVTLLPALGVTLPSGSSLQGGTLSADMAINGPVDKLVITGPVKLANTKLHGFDMGSKMAAISVLSGVKTGPDTTIQNLSSNMHLAPAGIQFENINLVVPSIGTVTGNGTVSPQDALDYKMTASLNGQVVGGLSQLAGMSGKGASVPFFIQGTASDPKFVPDVKGMLGSQLGKQFGAQAPGGQNTQGVVDALTGLLGKKKK